ncbi:hypothetical protein D3C77_552430 [compost metagenome]
MNRIKQTELASISRLLLMRKANVVRYRFTALLVDDSKHVFLAWCRYFLRIGGNFDRRLHLAILLPFNKLVHPAKRRLVCSRNKLSAHAPNVDPGPLGFQVKDRILIQIVRGDDFDVRQTCLIEHFASLDRQVGQIAAIQPNAAKPLPFTLQ